MPRHTFHRAILVLLLLLNASWAESPRVEVRGSAGQWELIRDGQPYFIRGVGGDGSWKLLSQLGGNSVRTWGHERLTEQLDEAHKLGLTVTAGIWLGQVRQGFDWADAASLIRQRAIIREAVLKYKDHPALLMWSLGNEMEDPQGKNGAVWSEINNLARMVKQLDPRHPVMTVVAEIGGDKVANFHALCPDVDILGINSYAGAASVGERYVKLGGTKPYVLTEFGPPGIWEIGKDDIGAYRELTSTAKVDAYVTAYRKSVVGQPGKCLGSYAFMWGQKQEVTATWFSLLLKDDSRLGAVDALEELWTSKPPRNRCPRIDSLTLTGPALVKPGEKVTLHLQASDPEADATRVTWELLGDEEQYGTGGDAEAEASHFAKAVVRADSKSAEIELPPEGGLYRVFVTVRDSFGGAAIANVPVRVDAPEKVSLGKPVSLPFTVYEEGESTLAYIPSGWMGNAKAMQVDPASANRPHAGKTCLRFEYSAASDWGGVAWQHPAQDWGDKRGGFNLTGAKKLVFYARGETGGEAVTFGVGLIEPGKKYFDTARRPLGKVKLTADWQRYEINLSDLPSSENLTRIKTGFYWTIAGTDGPLVFYLDDVRFE